MELKECPYCQELLPLTTEYYCRNKNSVNGFNSMCKVCKKKYDRELYKKKKKLKKIKRSDTQVRLDKKAEEGYQKLLNEPRDYGIGDKLNTLKLENGKNYKIEHIYDQTNNIKVQFIGKLVGQTDNLIVLRHKLGYTETFRKYDILSSEYQLKEVQR